MTTSENIDKVHVGPARDANVRALDDSRHAIATWLATLKVFEGMTVGRCSPRHHADPKPFTRTAEAQSSTNRTEGTPPCDS